MVVGKYQGSACTMHPPPCHHWLFALQTHPPTHPPTLPHSPMAGATNLSSCSLE